MKKRLITLLLALCLCCGLSVPGLAASEETASSIDVFVTALDAGYKALRQDMIDYRTMKQNVDRILGLEPEEQTQQQEQKSER